MAECEKRRQPHVRVPGLPQLHERKASNVFKKVVFFFFSNRRSNVILSVSDILKIDLLFFSFSYALITSYVFLMF